MPSSGAEPDVSDGSSHSIPVVVTSEDGRTLSLDVPPRAPLRRIAPAIEKHFKIAPTSQVLKYNGDPLQLSDSLQSAGALLLPGEPYVKLHLQTARGNLVSLVGSMPNGKEIPISVHESSTFKEIKALLCKKEGSGNLDPKTVRLYFRYNELVDRASPQYYHLPNNSKIEVVRKPDFDFEAKRNQHTTAGATSSSGAEQQRTTQTISKKKPAASAAAKRRAGGPVSPRKTTAAEGSNSEGERRNDTRVTSARVSTTSGAAGGSTNFSSSRTGLGATARPSSVPANTRTPTRRQQYTPTNTKDNRPKAYYELEKEESEGEDEDERRIRLMAESVAAMKTKLGASSATTSSPARARVSSAAAGSRLGGGDFGDADSNRLRKELREMSQKYQMALDRIEELEQTVERYQRFCRKCLTF